MGKPIYYRRLYQQRKKNHLCVRCGVELGELSTASCFKCLNKRRKENCKHYEKIFKNNKELIHGRNLNHKFRITKEEYNLVLMEQGNVCAICHLPRENGWRLCVDHNHYTGKVRGLLCTKCNTAIGLVDESMDRLYAIIAYLKKRDGLNLQIQI
jgi:hypothetical protein